MSDWIEFIAGDDLKAGERVNIESDGLVYLCKAEETTDSWLITENVKKGDSFTYNIYPVPEREVITMQLGALDQKQWAVLYDDGATCDLTHQEARQMCKALVARDINSATIVANEVGKRAQKQGYLRTPDQN